MNTGGRVVLSLLGTSAAMAQTPDQTEFFEKRIRPVFAKNCAGCHNPQVHAAGLDLTTPGGITNGGQAGSLFSKQAPAESLLLKVLSYDEKLKMPPTGKLAEAELEEIRLWTEAGSPMPAPAQTSQVRPKNQRGFTEEEKKFWAFQKTTDPALPGVKDKTWAKTPIDHFILAKLEAKGLQPSPPADKLTLLRRVTFDLTGLPPTTDEVQAFLADRSPKAFEKVVDRLLASPRYGEHWGRHWLDVARYADSTGNDEDHRYPYAWRYRDYVIDAFNRDLPYDQFVREQIAGDLMPAGEPGKVNGRGIVATGFLALGAKAVAQQDKKKMLVDIYDEQIDILSKGFMGVTLSCARCHDHKFDPLLTKDYYSMLTIFANTKNFKNADSHVSSLLYTPLVPQAEYEGYLKGREVADKKKGEIEDVLEARYIQYTGEVAPKVAGYMIGARKVYKDGGKPVDVAREKNLDEKLLSRWVGYLKPGSETKAHLEEWHKATDASVTQAAAAYQERYQKWRTEWVGIMERTRPARRKRMRDMPPPTFDADKDRFFYEVQFKGPMAVDGKEREKLLSVDQKIQVAKLNEELKALESKLPPEPEMACAVAEGNEGGVVAGKVFVRGDYNSLGEDAPKGFPAILTGSEQPTIDQGSGRLQLARWLTTPDHPLTARVFANRVWYWHFGEGIVRTPDNFGKMGERPTHPELLDYLSKRFVEGGWSTKALHKMIVLSNTYQVSSTPPDATFAADLDNKLFSRFPRRRLSVEELRDGLLAIDGSIDLTMGGSLQSGFGTDDENSNSRLSVRPEAIKRRLVYLPLRRANLPSLLNLFDFGDATSSASKRSATTIAPQALFMMNSDFVTERATNLTKQVLDDASLSPAERVRWLYIRVLNRPATAQEVDNGLSYISSFEKREHKPAEAWMSYSRVLIASNEYIFLD